MSVVASDVRRPTVGPLLLLVGFTGAVLVRAAVAGPGGAASRPAALTFAGLLAALAVGGRVHGSLSARAVLVGLAGAVVLVLPVLALHGVSGVRTGHGYPTWVAATAIVATAEEAFLRGALFDAVARARGTDAAVIVAAVAFAALHVPLYGWGSVPLDLAVGLALGALRLVAGTWTAPAIAHVGADLVGWWLP